MFNRSHKSKKTRPNSGAPPTHRELFTQRISRFSNSRFLCCHLVEIKDVITPRKITWFTYKSRTEQRIRWRQKCRYFEEKTQNNSKRGEQLQQSNSGGEVGDFDCVSHTNFKTCHFLFKLLLSIRFDKLTYHVSLLAVKVFRRDAAGHLYRA